MGSVIRNQSMRHFLVKILFFVCLFLLLIFCLNKLTTRSVSKNIHYHLPDTVQTVILGHSHAEAAYNDSLLPNSINLGQSGEAYIYTYLKLRKILAANAGIEKVVLEVTNNNLLPEMDDWSFDQSYIRYRYPKYGHLLTQQELWLFMRIEPRAVLEVLSVSLKNNLDYLRNRSIPFYKYAQWGQFEYHEVSKLDSLKQDLKPKTVPASESNPDSIITVSKYNLIYLDSIVNLCKQARKQLIFVRAPQHFLYTNPITDRFLKQTLRLKYPQISFIDFGNLPLPDHAYRDFHHVNYIGAEIVSRRLDSILKTTPLLLRK